MTTSSKLWKLTVHQQTFSEENVIIQGDYPGLVSGDVVEVYHPEGNYSRLLVEVREIQASSQAKGSISIQSSLASSFHLRQYNDVIVRKVERESVSLDMLELVIKDHFLTRSDTWRLHQKLIDGCVYFCNKVSFLNMRVHVNELWMKGDKVACGVVSETTKVVYRSQSSKFHIFVQMSAEMWEFDYSGDLYFEKAIMGFLQELFTRWKDKMSCNHQVVIVLFSRTYYPSVKSIDEFSKDMQREVLCTHDGRFYQDFYKIIRQSEKQDNLQNVILDLKQSFHGYPHHVRCQQPFTDGKQEANPKGLGVNSRAYEGNLLEAINMSLNVFEKNYIDCNLEETNCTTLVITPSTGVFEVEEDLKALTKKRLIENGVGIDLVCLAQQPLHAVPLFKFIRPKDSPDQDIYNVPQWINLSYYSPSQLKSSVYIPRMQVPRNPTPRDTVLQRSTPTRESEDVDYDEFDARVFDYSRPKPVIKRSRLSWRPGNTFDISSTNSSPEVSKSVSHPVMKKLSLQENNPTVLLRSLSEDQGKTTLHDSFDEIKFIMGSDKDDTPKMTSEFLHVSADNSIIVKQSSLNPFKPHSITHMITLFKQRWLHAFPMNMKGYVYQVHHQKINTNDENEPTTKSPAPEVEEAALATVDIRKKRLLSGSESDGEQLDDTLTHGDDDKSIKSTSTQASSKLSNTQHEDWTATIITGVDWKSLCMPACLPLTINYFPDEKNLNDTYFEYHYTMVIEDLSNEALGEDTQKDGGRFDRSSMPPEKKFEEMISQRLAQGFQFVTHADIVRILKLEKSALQSMRFQADKDYVLSMGPTLHHLSLKDTEVHVTRYSLRESLTTKPVTYRYNIWPHNCLQYTLSETTFAHDSADKYNWNSLDRYICESEKEFSQLNEYMKYWRTRFLLLPVRRTPFAPREIDGMGRIEGFLRFLEGMNKIKRGTYNRMLFYSRAKSGRNRKVSSEHVKLSSEGRNVTPERKEQRSVERKSSPMQIDNQETNKETQDKDTHGSTPRTPSSTNQVTHDDLPPEHSLSMTSPLNDIIKTMTDTKYGLSFLPKQDNLYNHTFISAEAVAWMIKTIDDCNTKFDAVNLGQRLLESKLIMHASLSPRQNFIDGFFLYFVKEEKKEEDVEKRGWFTSRKTEEELLTSYNIQWLEAAVWRDDNDDETVPFLLEDLPPPEYIHSRRTKTNQSNVPLYKYMEYNLDAENKSGRSEWCALSYHGNYHPNKCAYAIEMNWMAATGSIVAELVQKWSHKAQSCGVHIVPAPMCAFPGKSIRCNRNPFRRQPFIPLNIECLLKHRQRHLFEDYDPKTWPRRMFLFQQAILRRFDFLRDIPQTAPESSVHGDVASGYQYIHASGSILMKVNDAAIFDKDYRNNTLSTNEIIESPFRKNRRPSKKQLECEKEEFEFDMEYRDLPGFFWVYNYALSKKWRTTYTGDVACAKVYVKLFSDFCDNKDDELLEFWRQSCADFLSKRNDENMTERLNDI